MKNRILLLPLALLFFWIIPAQAQTTENLPPQNLSYVRLWTDSIRLQWNQPVVSSVPKAPQHPEVEWKELNVDYVGTYRLRSTSRSVLPRNPASDGKYIYMSTWTSTGFSEFYKYDLYGTFIEKFTIEGVEKSLRDLAYDGTYFYGGYEGVNKIVVLDLENKRLVGGIDVNRPVRHICYIPTLDNGKGGFEIGDFGTSAFIDREGRILKDSAMEFYVKEDSTYTNSPNKQVYGTAYHNGKIYTHSQLGVMDFTVGMPIPYSGPYSSIIEYDAATGKPTGNRLAIASVEGKFGLPGYAYGAGIEILEFPKGTFKLLLGYQHAMSTSGTDSYNAPLVVLDLEKAPLPAGLSGYNLYADGTKINTEPIDRNRYFYDLGKVEQGKDIQYELKAVYGAQESAAAQTTVNLYDTRLLPFMEDFNSLSLEANFWKMEDTAITENKPWSVVEVPSIAADLPSSYVLDYNSGGGNPAFSATVNSREFNFGENNRILVRYELAQSIRNRGFVDTLFLEINTGEGWKTVNKDTTVYGESALEYRTIDISDMAAGKAGVSFRFRVKGNSRTEEHPSGYGYHFYIDNFKIWEPVYVAASGAITFNGEAVENVKVELRKKNDILVYTVNSDADGVFTIDKMETGSYELVATRSDFNTYVQDVEIVSGTNKFEVRLLQPAFQTATDSVKVVMKPNENMRSGFILTNSGTGAMKWNASFTFPETKATEESFEVLESWKARGNVETSYAYLNDTIYSYYRNSGSGMVQLLKTTKDGVALAEETELPFAKYSNVTTVFADRDNLYFTLKESVYKYDKENNCFTDTIKTGITTIAYATWNPIANTIMLGNVNGTHILEMDMAGDTVKLHPVRGLGVQYIAFDPTPADGPVLWLARSNFKPESGIQGEYLGLYEYSLAKDTLTDRYFIANKHPQYVAPVYSQRQTASLAGLFGTTEYFPGRYTLFVTTKLQAQGAINANLCAMYDVAQSVKWIGMETYKGELAAGESSNFYLHFNAEDLKQGDRKKCVVNIKADINVEPLHLPVILEIDSLYESPCATPSGLRHEVEGSRYVDLSWKVETSGGALVTEGLKGFSVMRNGILLTDTLLTSASFRDMDPIMGINVYQVQAYYQFETSDCSSPWSAADTVRVVYDGTCAGITNLTATINNQRHVTLMWDYPRNEAGEGCINESFETFDAFRIDSIGHGWTSFDVDRGLTYGITNVEFPHHGEALPFIVYNPMKTTPSSIEKVGAYSGMQVVAAFSSRVEGLTSNDWLISPEIADAGSSLSLYFMAKTAFINYGYEELKVAYSTTGKQVEDFVYLNEGRALNVPGNWTEYSYRLPEGTKYVAFNYVSKNKFMLLIDDIYIGPTRHHMRLENYAVYKNNQLLQEVTPMAFGFYDFALKDGEYSYTVAAKYNNGCVSAKSEPAVVDIAFKHGITPARGLTASVEEKSINLTWKEPAWGEPEQVSYHHGMSYGFSLSDNNGNAAPFYAAIKFDMNNPLLLDYSISALRVGFFGACKASAFIIDLNKNRYVAEQPISDINAAGFTTVTFDDPVKLEMGNSYLLGVHIEKYENGTYAMGQDNGPLAVGYGDYISFDGMEWSTVSNAYNGEILANFTIDAILEVLDKPAQKKAQAIDTRKVSFAGLSAENTVPERCMLPSAVIYNNIEPKAAEPEVAIEGYQLYRDGEIMQKEPQLVLQYEDVNVDNDSTYVYWVKTFYENGESINSDSISVYFYSTSLGNDEEMAAGFGVRTARKHIFINNQGMALYDVTVHNLTGVCLYSRNSVRDGLLDIPMTNVPSGIYLVGIRQGNTVLVKKVYL